MSYELSATQPPLFFSATNLKFVAKVPNGLDELWSVDLEARRHGELHEMFENILFIESNGLAFIYGIQFEDGYPKDLVPSLAARQQAFIEFLRTQNAKDSKTLGWTALLFKGHEYRHEHKATAAYVSVRAKALNMGIGYHNAEGKYELLQIDPPTVE